MQSELYLCLSNSSVCCLFDGRTESGSCVTPQTDQNFVLSHLWEFLPAGSVAVVILVFHVRHIEVLERKDQGLKTKSTHGLKKRKEKKTPAGDPQIIPLSLYARLPSVVSSCLSQTPKDADIAVVGGRNNRDLVTLWKKYLKGTDFIQQAAQLHCIKR